MKNIDDHVRGDTLTIAFTIEADEIIDITSDDVAIDFSIKQTIQSSGYLVHKDKSAVETVADNSFVLRVAPEDTATLDERYYPYDLQLTIGSDVYTLAIGNVHIIADVTRNGVD